MSARPRVSRLIPRRLPRTLRRIAPVFVPCPVCAALRVPAPPVRAAPPLRSSSSCRRSGLASTFRRRLSPRRREGCPRTARTWPRSSGRTAPPRLDRQASRQACRPGLRGNIAAPVRTRLRLAICPALQELRSPRPRPQANIAAPQGSQSVAGSPRPLVAAPFFRGRGLSDGGEFWYLADRGFPLLVKRRLDRCFLVGANVCGEVPDGLCRRLAAAPCDV